MELTSNIQRLLGGLKTQVPPETFGKLEQMFRRLESARVGANSPKPGDQAPEAMFTTPSSSTVSLRDLNSGRILVLLFYRGRSCPFCDLTLRAYDAVADEFREAGAWLVAVSPQTVAETTKTSEERSLRYEVLRDPYNTAAQAFGLDWELTPEEQQLCADFNSHMDIANGDDEWRLPAPAVFVIDTSGTVRWSWVDSNWTRRAEPADVLLAIRAITTATAINSSAERSH